MAENRIFVNSTMVKALVEQRASYSSVYNQTWSLWVENLHTQLRLIQRNNYSTFDPDCL